jgi:GNAT superfamily N-acetyltransferase
MWGDIGGFSEPDVAAADPVYRRWLRPRLRSGKAWAVLAMDHGGPVGSAVVWLRDDQPRPGAPGLRVPYILSVYVDPGHRGRGIASRMTGSLLEWAKGRGYPRTVLHASKLGRSVYARLGFERTWEMRYGGAYGRRHPARARTPSAPAKPPPRRRRAPTRIS